MRRCLELASLGGGAVSPNPFVGCVIVVDNRIIGEGYHMKFGESHAEVNAIKSVNDRHGNAGELLKKATIYVNLEPCSHHGKTPPCADLIINSGIQKVVIGQRDPFEHVNGKGINKLKEAGLEVIEGVLEADCRRLNRRFITRIKKQRPFVILKWAQTSDKFFAPKNGSQKWITSSATKQFVHRWRSEEDAVLVGKNTVLADNPELSVRDWAGRSPVRIVVDRNLELSQHLHIFDQSQNTIIFNSIRTDFLDNIKYLELEDFDNLLPQLICYQLYLMDVQSVIIEGGAKMLNLFISAGLWDEARILTGGVFWGDGVEAPSVTGHLTDKIKLGSDTIEIISNAQQ